MTMRAHGMSLCFQYGFELFATRMLTAHNPYATDTASFHRIRLHSNEDLLHSSAKMVLNGYVISSAPAL